MNTLKRRKTMNRHAIIKGLAFVIVAMLLFSASANSAEQGLAIKMATLAPEGSSWMKTFNAINTEVIKQTKGTVSFKVYSGGVLGDEKDVMRKVQIGQIQAAALTSGGLAALYKEIDVLHVPFLFQNYGEVDYVLKNMTPSFAKGLEANGYILLGWPEGGFVYLMSTIPVSSVAELKKAKVWIWQESPLAKAIFNEVGVSAIPLSVPDVLVGLQTGMVEVVYTPPTAAISLQWFTRVKYITDVPLTYIGGGIIVRKDIFKKLSPATQDTIIKIFQRQMEQLKTGARRENQEAIKVMERNGVKIVTPTKDQVAEFKRLSDTAMARLANQTFSKKILDDITAQLEAFRKGKK
jgi:TRAP-type C4-dicarboxylate transport system substrate-binding protein